MKVLQINQQVKAVTFSRETCGGPHSHNECPTTIGQTQNLYAAGAYQGGNSYQPQCNRNLLSYRSDNHLGPQSKSKLKQSKSKFLESKQKSWNSSGEQPRKKPILPRRPTVPTTSSSLPQVVERETKVTKESLPPTNNGSTKDVQPSVVQTETPIPNSEPVVAPIIKLVVYPVNALILMPNFGPTIKNMLTNKDKLSGLARTPLNKHCSAVLLKKLSEKLGDPDKFLIPCDFLRMDECLALADLSASINLMPLLVWNKLSLPELSPTCMTLELTDRSISDPVEVTEDVFIEVGTFHFPIDFIVVNFDADPRVPLILVRSILKTKRALIDVFNGELTLRVGREAITFNLDQTSRYLANCNDMMANPIDVIDMACEEYSQEVLGFSDVIASVDAFLALEDDATSPEVDHSYYDPKGDILLLEAFLNDDPSLPLPNQGNYGGFTVVENEENELIPTRLVTGWCVCIDYHKLNEATHKDHFPLPFMDQILEILARIEYYCFLNGFSECLPTIACLLAYAMHRARSKAAGGTFMKRHPEECYDLIENMTAHHNDWDTSAQRITSNCETCGGLHFYKDCPATVGQTQNVYAVRAYQGNSYQPQGNRNLLSYRSDNYLGPPVFNQNQNQNNQNQNFQNQNRNQGNIHPQGNNQGRNQFLQGASHGQYPPPAYQASGYQALMDTASSSGLGTLLGNTITNPKEDLKGITTRSGTAYKGPMIPTTSSSLPQVVEHETEVTKDTVHPTNNGTTKDVQPLVFQVLTLMPNSKPVVAPIIEPVAAPVSAPKPNQKPLIPYLSRLHDQKLPLSELAKTPLNEHCSAVLLKKLPEKLGDPGKFLFQCDFPGMDECLALTDLGASINLMPLSMWNKLSLPELCPTCMTLELADRSISRPVGVAEDVFIKVGTFHFLADFVFVDFHAYPRVPLILERSFFKIGRALIDVFEGELTLRVGKEAIIFNLDQTSRYSANYNDMTVNRIDVINMACEEYSQELLGFSDVIASGNPTPYHDPIVSTSSPTLTPFGDSDFLLEEVDAFLALEDDPTSLEVDHSYFDTEGDILLLEVELKDLPPHLEYAFLEGDDKFPVIIVKHLSDEEKTALITVLKSHKRAITWKLSHIKGINPEFCTHKILMEEDFEPTVQHQRKSLCKPRTLCAEKGCFTAVENEDNELIPTCLVTGCRVCIDYHKLNEATHKEHFPLPFIDQMLKRLARNEYYCFLDGFSVFMDDFLVFRNSFQTCLSHLEKMLKQCEDTNLCLNWEKSHFMVKEGIVLGHKISKNEIEVDKAKVDVIAKLPHPTTVKEQVAADVVQPTLTSSLPSSPVIPSIPPHQSPCPPQPQDAKGSYHLFQQVLDTCSALVLRVEGLENANASQQLEIVKLQARGRISVDMDQDEGIELVVDHEKDAEVKARHADKQAEIYNIDLDHSSKVVAASTPIPTAKPKTHKIAAAPAVSTRRRKGVKKDQVEMDAEYAKKLHEELNKEHEEAYKQID
nr:hypothetical protein [Tanacetum cinerariifolium]